ncbi:MAG: hypothetical protein WCO52_02295 [bacterium]
MIISPSPSVSPLPYQLPIVGSNHFSLPADIAAVLPHVGDELIRPFLLICGVFAVIYLILGGIYYITSGGDAGRTKQARAMILRSDRSHRHYRHLFHHQVCGRYREYNKRTGITQPAVPL